MQEVQPSPFHVLIIDKHTLPLVYKFGFNLICPDGSNVLNTNLGGEVPIGTSRSRAGKPSFGDIQEASFYKYAQLQNTVRYLYSQKSRYKSIAKDKA